jgi:hypothetical protein
MSNGKHWFGDRGRAVIDTLIGTAILALLQLAWPRVQGVRATILYYGLVALLLFLFLAGFRSGEAARCKSWDPQSAEFTRRAR